MTPLRRALPEDAAELMRLERDASLAALGHVFPPDRFPYPEQAVLARWVRVLGDPQATTLLGTVEPGEVPVALVAFDRLWVQHLVVHPDHWGRGLARAALEAAVSGFAACGTTEARLWCLVENHRARGFYEHLGWRPTGEREKAGYPPHPETMAYAISVGP